MKSKEGVQLKQHQRRWQCFRSFFGWFVVMQWWGNGYGPLTISHSVSLIDALGYFQQISYLQLELSVSILPYDLALSALFNINSSIIANNKSSASSFSKQSELDNLFQYCNSCGCFLRSGNLFGEHGLSIYLGCLYSDDQSHQSCSSPPPLFRIWTRKAIFCAFAVCVCY